MVFGNYLRDIISLVIAITIVVMVTGCNSVKSFIDGRKMPKTESSSSVISYLKEKEIQYDQIALSKFEGFQKNLMGIGQDVAVVYDINGDRIAGNYVAQGCIPDVALLLKNLKAGTKPTQTDSNSNLYQALIPGLVDLEGNQFALGIGKGKDYVVFIAWSNWEGKKTFNRNVRSCLAAMKNNAESSFHVVLVNLDKQEVWGKDKLSKVLMTRTRVEILP